MKKHLGITGFLIGFIGIAIAKSTNMFFIIVF
jgi:hypothetical protein